MKLSEAGPGTYVIKSTELPRLIELGFVPGRKIKVIVNRKHMIIEIFGERFAISREIAEGVEVDKDSSDR